MKPRRTRVTSTFLDSPPPVVLAHQGLDLRGAKNTMRAFRQAVRAGAQYLETDVHASADGVVVVFHDDRLDETTDTDGAIAELTWQELSVVRVGGEPIPRLEDVLAEFPTSMLNIDVKAEGAVEALAAVLARAERERPGTLARICVASFSDQRRRAVLRRLPRGVCTSGSVREAVLFWLGSRLRGTLSRVGPWVCHLAARRIDAFQVPERRGILRVVDSAFVEAAHRHGLAVHVWTVNDETAMHRLLDLGVDGLVTDRCDLALRVVAERADTRGDHLDPGSATP